MDPDVLLTVSEAQKMLVVSRTTIDRLFRSGAIESLKVGKLRRVPVASVHAYIARQLREQKEAKR